MCLYQMDRRLLILNLTLFTLSIMGSIVLITLAYQGYAGIPTPQYLTGCYTSLHSIAAVVFVPGTVFTQSSLYRLSECVGLIYELWIFFLVAWGVYRACRRDNGSKTLMQLILMDSLKWFSLCVSSQPSSSARLLKPLRRIAFMIILNTVMVWVGPEGIHTIALP